MMASMFGFEKGELSQALQRTKGALAMVFVLSALLNILLLGGSLYMMLIYDSVLPSHSIPTLVGLLLMVIVVYSFQGMFDVLRSRMLADVGASMDRDIAPRIQNAIEQSSLRSMSGPGGAALAPLRDYDTIRAFIASPGPAAIMDLPWILLFLAILSLLHIWLGVATVIGAMIMLGLTFLADRYSRRPTEQLAQATNQRQLMADETRRHIEVIRAMGMGPQVWRRWDLANRYYLAAQNRLVRSSGTLGGISRIFRMFLQSAVLTVGALLVIEGNATGGVIFASSILSARALAPIDLMIANWKNLAAARSATRRLENLFRQTPDSRQVQTQLPAPSRDLIVDHISVVPPGSQRVTVNNVAFRLQAGDALGVVGMSAAGKSSLARALINVWPPARGMVRLDGAALDQWSPDVLGNFIGYLPQTVELLTGTVAENIARFQFPLDSDAIVEAARIAGVHDMIIQMPKGYDTPVGNEGDQLSAGQRQRVGLARALYGNPFLVVLDEPNSNLDAPGEAALDHAIQAIRERDGIAVIIAHRAGAIARCNYLLVMQNGTAEAFGPKDEVLNRMVERTRLSADAAAQAEEPKEADSGGEIAEVETE